MKNYIPVILFIIGSLSNSCSISRISGTSNDLNVEGIKILEPFSYIYRLELDDKMHYNPEASLKSKLLIIKVMQDLKTRIPYSGFIFLEDSVTKSNLETEIENLCYDADNSKYPGNI